MYYISKTLEISASHHLVSDKPSMCEQPHGHNYRIQVFCKSEELDEEGMVVDFRLIKSRIKDALDHKDLNEVLPFNTTSENIARWICDNVPKCWKVTVEETPSNIATYVKD